MNNSKAKQMLLDEKIKLMAEVEYHKYFAQNENIGSKSRKDCEKIIEEDIKIIKALDLAIKSIDENQKFREVLKAGYELLAKDKE